MHDAADRRGDTSGVFYLSEWLKTLPSDEEIDTSDIPEITDWSKSELGKFYRPGSNPEGEA
jgi:hypothetical protein